MAREDASEDASEGAPDEVGADQPCPPCGGSGELVSNLGGEPKTVPCPWCEGGGRLLPGHDAQAAFKAAPENSP